MWPCPLTIPYMRWIPITAILAAVSCAVGQASQEAHRIIPLIKAERYDEAWAQPELLAPAFVETLRQMKAEGADPKRIVAVADYFLANYPFCARDLQIDELILQQVIGARTQATESLVPSLAPCLALRAADTFVAKLAVLNSWSDRHVDGGRCAGDILGFLGRVLHRGNDWFFDTALTGKEGPVSTAWVSNLLDSCWKFFLDDPQVVLLAFRESQIDRLTGEGAWDSWCSHDWLLEHDQWARYYRFRRSWLGALRFKPSFDHVFDIHEELILHRLNPRLRELGAALKTASQSREVDPVRRAAETMRRTAPGTPFADAALFSMISPLLEEERPKEAEQLVRELRTEFSNPFYPGHTLLFIASAHLGDELTDASTDLERADRLAREVLSWDPKGPTASLALYTIGWVHGQRDRKAEMIACMQAALSVPKNTGPYEYEPDSEARSRAGLTIAHHFESRKEWKRALQSWQSWESHGSCGLHHEENAVQQNLGIARSLDGLGRTTEAIPHYWEGLSSPVSRDLEASARFLVIQRELGREEELKAQVRDRVKWLTTHRYELEGSVRWLAEQLGLEVK